MANNRNGPESCLFETMKDVEGDCDQRFCVSQPFLVNMNQMQQRSKREAERECTFLYETLVNVGAVAVSFAFIL